MNMQQKNTNKNSGNNSNFEQIEYPIRFSDLAEDVQDEIINLTGFHYNDNDEIAVSTLTKIISE